MTSYREQSVDEVRQQVRRETLELVALRLFDLLPFPTIAKVCDIKVEQVLALVRESESKGTVPREQSNRKTPTIKLLDQPICRTTIPMAVSTQRVIQRHQEVVSKLKKCLQSTER